MNIKFIHCSDLHLGCTPAHLDIRYNDFFDSFRYLINKAIEENCKYILISGDLFHLKVINSKTLLKVIELFDEAINNNIKIIAIEGNHDKAFYVDEDSWLEFLKAKNYLILLKHKIIENKLVLDSNSIYEDDNIRIIGIGYLGSTTQMYLSNIKSQIKKSKKFTVLMLHAAVNRLCGEEMGDINVNSLIPLNKEVDYIALGHIHTRYEYNDFIYNPGSLENIRLKDGRYSDKKGFNLVEYNSESCEKKVTFYKSFLRKSTHINIEINDLSFEETIDYLKTYDYNLEKESMLELILYGKVNYNPYLLNLEDLKNYIKDKYEVLYVEINNYINLITKKQEINNNIDISIIEEQTIDRYIQENYPSLNSKSITIDIKSIKEQILGNIDNKTIINSMIKEEE
ncbi:MAG: metallophosphoesterase [Bacilli bacterium]|nr:metallophosphoesterase [Acholeplasmataceae bacterium]MDY2903150.1 metallophosphoesterase [Bacilli bacterium]